VAVVLAPDGDTVAYVTDGDRSVDFLDRALRGRGDDRARLGNDGGAVLEVKLTDAAAAGTFTRPGEETHASTAEAAPRPPACTTRKRLRRR
jgi:hypothetical protein